MKKQTLLLILVATQIGLCFFSYIVLTRDRTRVARAFQRFKGNPTVEERRRLVAVASEDRRGINVFMYSCLVAICTNGAAILIVCSSLESQTRAETLKRLFKGLTLLVCLIAAYPLLVWLYCLTDDYILRRDAGRWEYSKGTFWHTYHFEGSDGQYDRQIDLCCPPYFRLGYDKR